MPPKSRRFDYVVYDAKSKEKQERFKMLFEDIEAFADDNLKDSRHKSLLMNALEEAYMWTGKAIRDEQIERDGSAHEPARSKE